MTWVIAVSVGMLCSAAFLLGVRAGERKARRLAILTAFEDGEREGLRTAYLAAKDALDAPVADGGTSRSIVGRAIVRKLRALAEGTEPNAA